jgi:hypothetical protein
MKPKELMTDKELEEYYMARRKAILQGDSGVLPDGRTVQQTREDYIEQCKTDPFATKPGMSAMEPEMKMEWLKRLPDHVTFTPMKDDL